MTSPRTKPETKAKLADPQQQFLLFINGIENLDMILSADPEMIAAGPVSSHLELYYEMCRKVRAKLHDIQMALLERAVREELGRAGRKAS